LRIPPDDAREHREQAHNGRNSPANPGSSCGCGRDRPDEPISDARQRLDVPRRLGIVAERDTQLAHHGVQAVVEIDDALRPEHLHQPLACDHFARMGEELDQHSQRLLGETLGSSVAQQLAGAGAQQPSVEMNVLGFSHLQAIIRK
jgi:hypothetical protein